MKTFLRDQKEQTMDSLKDAVFEVLKNQILDIARRQFTNLLKNFFFHAFSVSVKQGS